MGSCAYGLALGRSLALDAVPLFPLQDAEGQPRRGAVARALRAARARRRAHRHYRQCPLHRPQRHPPAGRGAGPRCETSTEPAASGEAQPLLRMPPVQRFSRADRSDSRAARRDRRPRRARTSRANPRSGGGDAALRRPHRILGERRLRPRHCRPCRDPARELPRAHAEPPHGTRGSREAAQLVLHRAPHRPPRGGGGAGPAQSVGGARAGIIAIARRRPSSPPARPKRGRERC